MRKVLLLLAGLVLGWVVGSGIVGMGVRKIRVVPPYRVDLRSGAIVEMPSPDALERDSAGCLLPNGELVIAGGNSSPYRSGTSPPSTHVQRLSPGSTRWTSMPSLSSRREGAQCTALKDGTLLVHGGSSDSGWNDSVELLSPHSDHWVILPNLERVKSVAGGSNGGVYLVQATSVTFAPEPTKVAWTVPFPPDFELTTGALDATTMMILGRAGSGTGLVLDLAPGADTWTERKRFSISTDSNLLGAVRTASGFLVLNKGGLEQWSLPTGTVDFISRVDEGSNLLALDDRKAVIFSRLGSVTAYEEGTRSLKQLASLDGEGGAFVAGAANGFWVGGTRTFVPPAAVRDGVIKFGLSLAGIVVVIAISRRWLVPWRQLWTLALGVVAGALLHVLLSGLAGGVAGAALASSGPLENTPGRSALGDALRWAAIPQGWKKASAGIAKLSD